MSLTKECEACGKEFYKRTKDSVTQWMGRRYCSMSCRNKSTKPTPLHIRFWSYVLKTSGCWEWKGATDGHGYGQISRGAEQSPYKAYRLSYEMFHGPIPEGLLVRHKCDNPICVNPDHLEVGTQKDNMQDASRRGRLNPKSLLNLKGTKSKGVLEA